MNLKFCLGWQKDGKHFQKHFKSQGALQLFEEYLKRISFFCRAEAGPLPQKEKLGAACVWLCHPGKPSRMLTSPQLADSLAAFQNSGKKELQIWIGDANGFSADLIRETSPQFIWSFGPLTLPHELAAAVAAEQLYRAWTILRCMPYHTGH